MWLRKLNKAGNQRSAPPNSAQMIIDSSLFTVGCQNVGTVTYRGTKVCWQIINETCLQVRFVFIVQDLRLQSVSPHVFQNGFHEAVASRPADRMTPFVTSSCCKETFELQ